MTTLPAMLYDRAKKIALSNSHDFHLVAILFRGKSIVKIGPNLSKTSPRFQSSLRENVFSHQLHAEMNVLRFAKPGDRLVVLRFTHDHNLAIAKPCKFCQQFIKETGIRDVMYSDSDGKLKRLELN